MLQNFMLIECLPRFLMAEASSYIMLDRKITMIHSLYDCYDPL